MSSVYILHKPLDPHIRGCIRLNGSKSISNRVLIINALCGGKIAIDNLSNADDTVFMQRLLESDATLLDAGAGGTTFRFLTAYLATQEGREVVLTGSQRMQQRPVRILVDALKTLGADISYEQNEGFPPLRIKGKRLKGGKLILPADTSSQYITALLLIAPALEEGLQLELSGTIVSLPYIRMTLKMMDYFGIQTSFVGKHIFVHPGKYKAKPFFVEGDWSAASYFYSIAVLAEQAGIELQGLTDQQIQGDAVIASIARDLGVETIWKDRAVVLKKKQRPAIQDLHLDFMECPDLAQTVVAFCAAAGITLTCSGLQTLRIKETDRIAALDNELRKLRLGTFTETGTDTWLLKPEKAPESSDYPPLSTYEDHRMAMAFAPLCLLVDPLKIEEPEVVSKSYPMFWKDLESLGFRITEED